MPHSFTEYSALAIRTKRGAYVPWTGTACRFCGDPVLVELRAGAAVRVAVNHDVPVCPEFAQQCEDFEAGA